MIKYTNEELEQAVKESISVSAVCKKLGYKQCVGGTSTYIKRKIDRLGFDTSHFCGQGWNKGNVAINRRSADDILVQNDDLFYRVKVYMLRRALSDIGREYKCEMCGIKEWNDNKLTLEIDHIDGNWKNNKENNLRYVCPNCHSQTDTYCKKENRERGGTVDA